MSTVHNLPVSHRQWSEVFTITLSSDETDYDLNAAVQGLGWNGTDIIAVQLFVEAGVRLNASATSTKALRVLGFPVGCFIKLTNKGQWNGNGAAGGSSGGGAGQDGGDCFETDVEVWLDNAEGEMNAGGGGGQGGAHGPNVGSIFEPKLGCIGTCQGFGGGGGNGYGPAAATAGGPGTTCNGPPECGNSTGANGAAGGGKGSPGGGASGGAPGRYAVGYSLIHWIATGIRNGGTSG